MTSKESTKLNQLINSWPNGAVYTVAALKSMGYRNNLITHYRNQRWLKSIGTGAVARYGDKVDWTGGLYAIQHQQGQRIHLGGKGALTLKGSAHFLSLGAFPLTLYGASKERLPTWFKKYPWQHQTHYYSGNLFGDQYDIALEKYDCGAYQILISSKERAMLEMLHLVPKEESFHESKQIMENLRTLRPTSVEALLIACTSVKVKRLFLLYADKLELSWLKRIDRNKIDLGSGKRYLETGDKLYTKYLITAPSHLFEEDHNG